MRLVRMRGIRKFQTAASIDKTNNSKNLKNHLQINYLHNLLSKHTIQTEHVLSGKMTDKQHISILYR